MSGTIFAVFMLLLPGMDQPKVQRIQMPSHEACLQYVEKIMVLVKSHDGIEQKAFVGCEVTGVKTDPS
jgi:hypothetical protein